MPAIAKTSDIDIINAATRVIETAGLEGLSMQAIGDAVGIKAPSLYKRFADRDAIVRGVQIAEFAKIARIIKTSVGGQIPSDAVRTIAMIHWTLAQERPRIYQILFLPNSLTLPEDVAVRTQALMPLFTVCKALVGPGVALPAARTLSSYIQGFITLKMSGAFDQGPGIEGSFYFGLNAIVRGIGG